MDIAAIYESRLNELRRKRTENEIYQSQIEANFKQIESSVTVLQTGQEALQFLEDIANSRRGYMKDRIEAVITEAFQMIYGDNYRVELVYSIKNNRSCLDIEVCKTTKYGEVRRLINGVGGGVPDTICVPLRLMVLLGSKQTDKVCVLDESYKHMDLERIDSVAEFIKELSQKLGMQIILLSHHEIMENYADKTWVVSDDGGKAIIK